MRMGFGFWFGLALFLLTYQIIFYPERTGNAFYKFDLAMDGHNPETILEGVRQNWGKIKAAVSLRSNGFFPFIGLNMETTMTRFEELRNKFRPVVEEEPEVELISVEEAIAPLLERFKDLTKQEILNMGGGACCCMGPQPGMPLCPCKLLSKTQEVLMDRWHENNKN